ncbi:MAG TPA: hypothetical protein VFR85_05035 [Anaeromyxobacteraceae bacterium]|nr:hypothetical protein [Anaeromyxobacteraceae bacterium]
MREEPGAPVTARARLIWAGAVAALALAALAAAEGHGRGSRRSFLPRPELRGRPVAMVGSAADAFRVWRAAGVRGRHLLVLTGQWSKPRSLEAHPPAPAEVRAARAGGEREFLDAESALFTAARVGIARSLEVVMPPSAFTHRLGEVAGLKELERGDGTFRLPFNGFERRFSTPRAFAAPMEPVLVLVEPTWFAEGAPADPLGWLSSEGVAFDLALLALEDPAASEAERRAALAFAQGAGAPFLEAAE